MAGERTVNAEAEHRRRWATLSIADGCARSRSRSTAYQFSVFSLFRLLAMTKLDACETQKGVSVSTGAKNPPGLDSKSGVVYETMQE